MISFNNRRFESLKYLFYQKSLDVKNLILLLVIQNKFKQNAKIIWSVTVADSL